ncbi:MAG: MerR family transcriptional regulator [Patescibacteria group bacterium]|nr:MerR family transcriptional regulator [Patescibacteria group bacterium]
MNKEFSITETAKKLAVNAQTLRRWDKSGRLEAGKKQTGKINRYFYDENKIEDFLSRDFQTLFKIANKWSTSSSPFEIPRRFYCPDKSIFKARLSRFEFDLSRNANFAETFPLIVAIAGEIGNNSYDHNLGNWPDVPGTFFGYNIDERKIVLADRGQGLLKTLKQVRPDLAKHSEALRVAFTELISGRAPEARGNGLKYVRKVVADYGFKLFFQTGDACLNLGKKQETLKIEKSRDFIRGAFALLSY